MEAGIVVPENKKYSLRVNNLKELITEVKRDVDRMCQELMDVADDVDRRLSL
jgi:hypothetical protein